jgi:UDP-glucose 4-epimerase
MANRSTVVVTGGAGFIGSELVELLLPRYEVVSLDNYFIGTRENHRAGVRYVEGSTKDIEALLGDEKPDIIFHLGEYSRVEQSFDDIERVWELNVEGTFRVLQYWKKRGCKLVYAGSSTKFADGGLGRNQSPYAWMKATNTELIQQYGEWFNLPYAIVYFNNAYGPRELSDGPYASVIGRFKKLHAEGRPLTVVSPGSQRRNFTHVHDLARGVLLAGEKGHGDGYVLGDPRDYSILEIAEMFGGPVEMLPERKGNRLLSKFDISKVQRELGWEPEHSVKEYIESIKTAAPTDV